MNEKLLNLFWQMFIVIGKQFLLFVYTKSPSVTIFVASFDGMLDSQSYVVKFWFRLPQANWVELLYMINISIDFECKLQFMS